MQVDPRAPWMGAPLSFAGWVPNVGSHLSFSMIGASQRAEAYTRAFHAPADAPRRLVLALERRVSNDYPWWTPLVEWFRRDLIHFWLLDAETRSAVVPTDHPDGSIKGELDRQGMLVGRVHVMPHAQASPHDPDAEDREAEKAQVALVKQIAAALAEAPFAPDNVALEDLVRDVRALLHAAANRVEVQFALMRTGELRLWYADPAHGGLSPKDLGLIAEQAYFFIKDVVHDHTHHDASSDQITPLVRIDDKGDQDHAGEIAWRRETLWSLSREVERLNRDRSLISLRRSLGVIAYADAFQQVLMRHVRNEDDPVKFERVPPVHSYDFAHLKDSIKASIDVAAAKRAQAVQLTVACAATVLSGISVVGSMVSAHNGALDRRGGALGAAAIPIATGQTLIRLLALNPFLSGLSAALIMFWVASLSIADGRAGIYNRLQRVLSQSFRAISVTLAPSPRFQILCDRVLHLIAIGLTLGVIWLCFVFLDHCIRGIQA